MNIKWSLCVLLLWASAACADEPARLVYWSAIDFTKISVTLKRSEDPDPSRAEVSVTLSPEARARTQSITLLTYQRYLTLYVDGYRLNTSRVQGQLGGEFVMFAPRALVNEWISQFSREAVASQPTM
ncbi:hypothetical protein [Pseudomonas sp. S5D5]|uniref:hypothetical protein n=1 Tax=Pseudomonas sp. S5D5 TaxID=2083056 RepID=UPI0015B2B75B|nr:hypothetical protein [Pseudomonas sp. S5D5]